MDTQLPIISIAPNESTSNDTRYPKIVFIFGVISFGVISLLLTRFVEKSEVKSLSPIFVFIYSTLNADVL